MSQPQIDRSMCVCSATTRGLGVGATTRLRMDMRVPPCARRATLNGGIRRLMICGSGSITSACDAVGCGRVVGLRRIPNGVPAATVPIGTNRVPAIRSYWRGLPRRGGSPGDLFTHIHMSATSRRFPVTRYLEQPLPRVLNPIPPCPVQNIGAAASDQSSCN
jgi:hypothetical protein